MKWDECLLKEARSIIQHRKGKLELTATKREGYVSVSILAGKRWDFDVPFDKSEID